MNIEPAEIEKALYKVSVATANAKLTSSVIHTCCGKIDIYEDYSIDDLNQKVNNRGEHKCVS